MHQRVEALMHTSTQALECSFGSSVLDGGVLKCALLLCWPADPHTVLQLGPLRWACSDASGSAPPSPTRLPPLPPLWSPAKPPDMAASWPAAERTGQVLPSRFGFAAKQRSCLSQPTYDTTHCRWTETTSLHYSVWCAVFCVSVCVLAPVCTRSLVPVYWSTL